LVFIKVRSTPSALKRFLLERKVSFQTFLDRAPCDRLVILSCLFDPFIKVQFWIFIGMIGFHHSNTAVSRFVRHGSEGTELKSVIFIRIQLELLVQVNQTWLSMLGFSGGKIWLPASFAFEDRCERDLVFHSRFELICLCDKLTTPSFIPLVHKSLFLFIFSVFLYETA
jgi:hypothetical protein